MNIRQNLFGQGPKAGREQSGYGRPPPTPPSYAREDTPMMSGYDAGGRPSVGRTSVNGAPRPHLSSSRYPTGPTSPSRMLRLNIAKVEDKTLANQYIFSNR
jgi:vesicle-fusing ATPase